MQHKSAIYPFPEKQSYKRGSENGHENSNLTRRERKRRRGRDACFMDLGVADYDEAPRLSMDVKKSCSLKAEAAMCSGTC